MPNVDDVLINQDITPEELESLTDQEKEILFNMLNELNDYGSSNTLKSIWYEDYEEVPVDIDTFIDDERFLGNALGNTLYPFWREVLRKLFAPGAKYYECVLTGAIGLGKTTIADIGLAYMLHKLLCLKNPPSYYGLSKMSIMTINFFNVTLDLSYGVAYQKFQSMVLSSPWFREHGTVSGTKNMVYSPGKNIQLEVGSKEEHALGQDVFCVTGDTVIRTLTGDFRIKDLISRGRTLNVAQLDKDHRTTLSGLCRVKETKEVTELIEIETEDGGVIRCTEDHPLMLQDGTYKKAGELTESDELMNVRYDYEYADERLESERARERKRSAEYRRRIQEELEDNDNYNVEDY